MNDLPFKIQSSEVRCFTDDIILYIIIDNAVDGADALNDDLERLDDSTTEWIVKFSLPEPKSLLITKKKVSGPVFELLMEGLAIEEVTSLKHFRVIISNELRWREHIENMTSSAAKYSDVHVSVKAFEIRHCYISEIGRF